MIANRDDLERVASEILRYLQRRPDATDTVGRNRRVWLPRIRLEEAAETVEQALQLLEERSLIERVTISSRLVVYRRVREAHGPTNGAAHHG